MSKSSMSSKRKQEEEYNSEEDEDFVPDANDEEESKEIYRDDDEVPSKGKQSSNQAKKKKLKKAASSERPRRKGPFDSEDELSDPEQEEAAEAEEASEPPLKKPKMEDTYEGKPVEELKKSSGVVEDFYAMLMRGKAPTTKPKASASTTPSTAPTATSTPSTNGSSSTSASKPANASSTSQDPLAFFAAMKKSSTSSASSSKTSVSSSDSKLAVPASWLASAPSSEKPEAEEELPASLLAGPQTVTIKETYEYAGQQVEVERQVGLKEAAAIKEKKAASGLGDLLDQLKGKNRITTLQKSKLDWNQFTDEQDLGDEFAQNRKDGYLQKQEFLRSVDAAEQDAARDVRIKASKAAAAAYKR